MTATYKPWLIINSVSQLLERQAKARKIQKIYKN